MLVRFFAWAAVACGLIVGFAAVLSWQSALRADQRQWNATQARNQGLPIPVRTQLVANEMVSETIGATCVTDASAFAPLISVASSDSVKSQRIEQVLVFAGDTVQKGDVLFELDTTVPQLLADQAKASVNLCQSQLEAYRDLNSRGAASDAEVKNAEHNLTEAQLQLELAKSDLLGCVIRSPVDGVVGNVRYAEGAVLAGPSELTSVYRMDPITVVMDFPIERLASLRVGQTAEVVLDSFPNETFAGEVVGYAHRANAKTRVIPTYVKIPNPDLRVRGGITGYCRLTPRPEAATVAPSVSVIERKGEAMVIVVEEDRARLRSIKVGPMVREGYVAIQEGLQPEEEVVIFGQESIVDGDEVNTDWRDWARRPSQQLADASGAR